MARRVVHFVGMQDGGSHSFRYIEGKLCVRQVRTNNGEGGSPVFEAIELGNAEFDPDLVTVSSLQMHPELIALAGHLRIENDRDIGIFDLEGGLGRGVGVAI